MCEHNLDNVHTILEMETPDGETVEVGGIEEIADDHYRFKPDLSCPWASACNAPTQEQLIHRVADQFARHLNTQ